MSENRNNIFANHPEISKLADTLIDRVYPKEAFSVAMKGLNLQFTTEEVEAAINEAYKRNSKMMKCEAA